MRIQIRKYWFISFFTIAILTDGIGLAWAAPAHDAPAPNPLKSS